VKRLATLGASVWLICLGLLAVVELVLALVTKDATQRGADVSLLIFAVVFGILYFLVFWLLRGWKPATWDGPTTGRQVLLVLLSVPGLIAGSVVLIFIIWFWLSDDSDKANYHLDKKKKPAPLAPGVPDQTTSLPKNQ
jgi:uncharacterized membrane-anchored protein